MTLFAQPIPDAPGMVEVFDNNDPDFKEVISQAEWTEISTLHPWNEWRDLVLAAAGSQTENVDSVAASDREVPQASEEADREAGEDHP